MDASERLLLDEPFESFDAQRELSQSQRSLARQASFAESLEMFGQGVLRTVNYPEVFPAAALHCRLQKPASIRGDELHRLHHCTLAAGVRQGIPPCRRRRLTGRIRKVDDVVRLDGPARDFTLKSADKPLALYVDPRFDVFRRLDPRETPPSIGQIFGEPAILALLPSGGSPEERARAENQLTGMLRSLFALSERYPQLRANENFLALQKSLQEIEDALQNARRYYNAVVRDFNTKIAQVPWNLFASMFNFTPREFFQVGDEAERAVPQVTFN